MQELVITLVTTAIGFAVGFYSAKHIEGKNQERISLFEEEMAELKLEKEKKAEKIVNNAIDEIDKYRDNLKKEN